MKYLGSIAFAIMLSILVACGTQIPENFNEMSNVAELVERLNDPKIDSQAFWTSLSQEQQKAVDAYVDAHLITSEVEQRISTERSLDSQGSCKSLHSTEKAKNAVGGVLWTYHQKIHWCYDGSTVYNTWRERWGETSTPGWSYKGHFDGDTRLQTNSYYAWTQGHFELCIAWKIGCIQNNYPRIARTVYANGTWSK